MYLDTVRNGLNNGLFNIDGLMGINGVYTGKTYSLIVKKNIHFFG